MARSSSIAMNEGRGIRAVVEAARANAVPITRTDAGARAIDIVEAFAGLGEPMAGARRILRVIEAGRANA